MENKSVRRPSLLIVNRDKRRDAIRRDLASGKHKGTNALVKSICRRYKASKSSVWRDLKEIRLEDAKEAELRARVQAKRAEAEHISLNDRDRYIGLGKRI